MKNIKEIAKNKKLWAGLNKPEMDIKDVDVVIFGVPFDEGVSFRSGTKDAPDELRNITYTISPTTENFESFQDLKVLDLGNAEGNDRTELFNSAEEITLKILKEKKFFTMIGGDHSTTIPIHRAIDKYVDEQFGIIHIDAHFDLCDDMDGDKLSHGSTERRALELNNVDSLDNLFFIGVRSIESDEFEIYNNNNVNVISSKEINKIGTEETIKTVVDKMKKFKYVYITLDIDCLDPAYAAGTGTPKFGGMTSRELLNILEGLFELPIIGMDIVEVAPKLDPSLTALFAARRIVTECWGHIYRKMKNVR
ncbi:agmatinase [Clostridiaceae bacterium HSG29]|nr:agmatinase [Clostridiaceae bacterium HSG29]